MDIKVPKGIKSILIKTIKECKDQVDFQGWRYSINVGVDTYIPFEVDEEETQKSFWYASIFLKNNFVKKSQKETVSSNDLKHAFEKWWQVEYPNEPMIYISNGVMLLAIVYSNFAPNDLWYGMDLCQCANIQKAKWNDFCLRYQYEPKNNIEE